MLADPGRAVEELLRTQGAAKVLVRNALVDQDVAGRPVHGLEELPVRLADR